MCRLFITLLFCCCSVIGFAQKGSRLSLIVHDDKWMVKHKVVQGDNLFLLSRRYHVPPAMLADANGLSYGADLGDDTIIFIPLGAYNYLSQAPAAEGEAKPIFYKVTDDDNLGHIGRRTGVSQRVIQDLNSLPDNDIEPGQRLQIGWVRYDATQMSSSSDGAIKTMEKKLEPVAKVDSPKTYTHKALDSNSRYKIVLNRKEVKEPDGTIAVYVLQDTVWADTLGLAGKVYMQQTHNETLVLEEKGTIVFYDMPGKVKSTKVIYALHNTLSKGTAVRVYNPGTGKFVFVKVVGPIPDTKQYHNAILAVGVGARTFLGVDDEKAWCELKYSSQQ